MSERLTFDSEPLLAFFLGERGGEIVKDRLSKIQRGEAEGFINVINLSEVNCILYRMNPLLAEEKCQILSQIRMTVLPIENNDLWRNAARIKAGHSLSLADAFAIATAEKQKSTLVISRDKEYNELNIKLLKVRD